MQELPKVALNRLRGPALAPHPDADLLTAFAEQSLPEAERGVVLDHLARCAGCREVVALALPATEEGVVAFRVKGGTPWLSSLVFRWGLVAACVAIVTSAGVFEYQQRHREMNVASNSNAVVNSQEAQPAAATARGMQPAASESTQVPPAAASNAANNNNNNKEQAPGRQGVSSRASSLPAEQKAFSNRNATALPPASGGFRSPFASGLGIPSRALTPGFARGSGSGSGNGPQSAPAPARVETQTSAEAAQDNADNAPEIVGKAKPAPKEASTVGLVRAPDLHTEPGIMKKANVGLRWTINASGALQRSSDGGATWQDVDVAAGELGPGTKLTSAKSSTVVEGISAASQAKQDADYGTTAKAPTQAVVAEKTKSAPAPAAIFRAVSVSSDGVEVWAGGSGSTLYHTTDAGATWMRIIPSENGAALSGDVVSIQFSDARNVGVTTSTAETWLTLDGGQNWRKQ